MNDQLSGFELLELRTRVIMPNEMIKKTISTKGMRKKHDRPVYKRKTKILLLYLHKRSTEKNNE